MTLYKSKKYWRVKFSLIKCELKLLFLTTGKLKKRDVQKYHDKPQVERWKQAKLGVKPKHTWVDAAAKLLLDTSRKRTHEWDKSMLRLFHPHLGRKELIDINQVLLDQVKTERAKGFNTATANRYMALFRTILRKACSEWEWLDRVPKVGMFRD